MKVVKGLLYFILIVVAVVLIAALFAPSEKTVERSITINASAEQIFPAVANFENWQKWDPWYNRDTSQIRVIVGTLGEENYGYSWKSDNDQVGNGKMTMVSFEENKSTSNHITMGEEGQSMEMDAGFTLEPDGEGTKVTWKMVSNLGFPWKIMHYMTEKWVGPDYEQGLENLKTYVESMPEETNSMAVEMITEFGVNYAITKAVVPFADMENFFNNAYGAIYGYLGTNGVEPKGNAMALYYTWDTVKQESELAAAVPISDIPVIETKPTPIAVGTAALGSNSLSYVMKGDYNQSMDVHNALGAWMAENDKEYDGPVIEEYIKGPSTESDPANFVTKITYYFE